MSKKEACQSAFDIAIEVAEEMGNNAFKESIQLSKDHHSVQVARAKVVFDELTNGLPEQPNEDNDVDYLDFQSDRLNKVIEDNLDANSIYEFLSLCGVRIADLRASIAGSARANRRHSKPGGSRDKRSQIVDAWLSGKYTSRDICAEQECAGLGMSFSAARRALRNIHRNT